MSVADTQRVIDAYTTSHDVDYVAPDAVFTDVASDQEYVGREAIAGMLDFVYHVAFDASAETTKLTVGDGTAVLEADFIGTHTGDFAGVPATGVEVRVPLVVSYDVADGLIQSAKIYFLAATFLQQIAEAQPATA